MTAEVLGGGGDIRLHLALYAVAAYVPRERMIEILDRVVAQAGMDRAGLAPAAWDYPLPSGQGGVGETICQPFVETVCQPLTASFILSDSWRDCGLTFVILGSCINFDPMAIRAYLSYLCQAQVEFQGWLLGRRPEKGVGG